MEERSDPINNAWYDWVHDNVSGDIEVVFLQELSGRDAPRPRGQYIGLQVIAGPSTKGFDELRKDNTSEKFTTGGERQYTINMQAFRSGSRQVLANLQTLLDSPEESRKLKESDADIAVVERGGVTDINALLETGFERRHSMDVIFNSSANIDTELGPIEKVQISGTGKDAGDGDKEIGPITVEKP